MITRRNLFSSLLAASASTTVMSATPTVKKEKEVPNCYSAISIGRRLLNGEEQKAVIRGYNVCSAGFGKTYAEYVRKYKQAEFDALENERRTLENLSVSTGRFDHQVLRKIESTLLQLPVLPAWRVSAAALANISQTLSDYRTYERMYRDHMTRCDEFDRFILDQIGFPVKLNLQPTW